MKTSRIIQFVVAAVLFSIGCIALLAHGLFVISTICFCLPVILMGCSTATRPISRRELWAPIAVLVICVAVVIVLKLLVSDSVGERVVRHPAFVIPLWVLLMSGLFWRWRRERRLTDA
jgi:FlaA1/EpsC-like NDP-sugar epimerase